MADLKAHRGEVLHFLRDPGEAGDPAAAEHFADGVLLVEDGRIVRAGPADALLKALPETVEVVDHRGKLIVPGFIDTHIHYAQTDMIASYGEQLLEWLNTYTFPAERRFADIEYARAVAAFFTEELLRNGTTTALVFATVHPQSVDAIFEAAEQRRMRMIAGKVMMDRHCPDFLSDTAESSYAESKALIERWHRHGRSLYAVTPRFAPTSTEAQLEAAAKLYREHDGVYLQSHVAENRAEVAWVAELFPWSRSYLDVYDRYGLLGERAVYAHCIWLDEQDRERMAATGTAAAFSPTSNLFLGSGCFDLRAASEAGLRVGMATDVGAGTSFSMLRTLAEAYKVEQLIGQKLPALRALYQATLGSARALYLDDRIGSFQPGREADFVVLDWAATPLQARRQGFATSLAEKLFALITLGDERNVAATYVLGEAAYRRD